MLIHYNMGSKSAIGIGNGICFKQVRDKGGGSYIDPLVRDSIVGLWKFDQNTNESPTRNIIKNTIKDKGGDLELLNFAYKLNSGYNGYAIDFTTIKHNSSICIVTDTSVNIIKGQTSGWILNLNSNKESLPNFKCKITGLKEGNMVQYLYTISKEDTRTNTIDIVKDGIYNFPASVLTDADLPVGIYNKYSEGNNNNITIEQLPLYEGALVTDGKDDMIVSQKTVQEMLGGSNVCTVVSMIHQINLSADIITSINNIRSESVAHVCARHLNTVYGKTSIIGYSKQVNTTNNPTLINNILGDKKDYIAEGDSVIDTTDKYFVQGYKYNDSLYELSKVAVYWTFISNKVLTTDEINQIIGYYKLDKYVTPQVIYDVKRQGLTNNTPAADWYLKDFSGNGHDMQLYNYAKKLNSGIGKYIEDFTVWSKIGNFVTITDTSLIVTNGINKNWLLSRISSNSTIESFKVKITGIPSGGTLSYLYTKSKEDTEATYLKIKEDGVYVLPSTVITDANISIGFSVGYFEDYTGLIIEQIPDYEGALVSDGKDDYGKAEGLPILKDYTVAVDRAIIGTNKQVDGGVSAKCLEHNNGSYVIDYLDGSFSYGGYLRVVPTIDRIISYQSKYISNGKAISPVNTIDANEIYIAKLGIEEKHSTIAVWSYLLFPYSLSEFLLERQLKKYKLGTLYPNMVEWGPIYSSNVNEYTVTKTTIFNKTDQTDLTIGKHYPIGSQIRFYVKPNGISDEVTSIKVNGVEFTFDYIDSTYGYAFNGTLSDKFPQKIDITIDEYIRFEDIVQPYPEIWTITQNGNKVSWGDKLKVGSEFGYNSKVNLLSDVYATTNSYYNGKVVKEGNILKVEKQMTFACDKTWKLNTTEPYAIYSPQKLNIPNSSLKILGYVPDLTGKGNHGKLNNFAYTEDSGVAADGSIKLDGIDDHITIPTLAHGGKCMMMKVNWNKDGVMLYDQRKENNPSSFAIYIPIFDNEDSIAYSSRNNGETYIDGVLNTYVKGSQLKDVTHNITITNSNSNNDNTVSPAIGSNAKYNSYFANMSLYEFMLFPEIPSEDEIKKLNDVMGIEGGYVESPNYYWDAYGKKNTDTDRNLIADQVSKDVANALEVKNVAYNSESGYTDDNGLLLDGVEDYAVNTVIPAVTDFTVIAKREFPESALANNQTFLTKGDAINGNNNVNSLLMECYFGGPNYIISFSHQHIVPLEESKISWVTPTSYNGNALTKGPGIDSAGLTIGMYKNLYRKTVFYKLMLYTKTIDQLSINMLKNLFEKDELIDVTNPIFKKEEL